GVFIAWLLVRVRSRMHNNSIEISLSLLTPFIAYLPAEYLGGTGVLATVAAGLFMGFGNFFLVPAATRLAATPVWASLEFVFDGILFLVAGMQLHRILEPLSRQDHRLLWEYGVGVTCLVILTRILWVFGVRNFLRKFGITMRRGEPNPRWQRFFIVSWSGMRG